jgi:hypothetical protein
VVDVSVQETVILIIVEVALPVISVMGGILVQVKVLDFILTQNQMEQLSLLMTIPKEMK